MKDEVTSRVKIPRSIKMRLILGDEQYEYIKDEVEIESFLQEEFEKFYIEQEDIIENENIREFFAYWIQIVSYYKYKFGRSIRDKDAVDKLKTMKDFSDIEIIYTFRNKLFKSDFDYDDNFKSELIEKLEFLKNIISIINSERRKKDSYFIMNKEW